MTIAPLTVKAATWWIRGVHRHLPEVQGGLFACAVVEDDTVLGVGLAANPARVWQGTGRFVISRIATGGAANACSALYGALCRAGKALGYREAWTYTLPEEPGSSLRAAGFRDMGLSPGGDWSCPSRPRKAAVRPEPKRRWVRVLTGERAR